MNSNKQGIFSVLGQIEETRQFTGYYRRIKLPANPPGTAPQAFKVGDKVKPLASGPWNLERIGEATGTVEEVYTMNGYHHYMVSWPFVKIPKGQTNNWKSERQKDLILA